MELECFNVNIVFTSVTLSSVPSLSGPRSLKIGYFGIISVQQYLGYSSQYSHLPHQSYIFHNSTMSQVQCCQSVLFSWQLSHERTLTPRLLICQYLHFMKDLELPTSLLTGLIKDTWLTTFLMKTKRIVMANWSAGAGPWQTSHLLRVFSLLAWRGRSVSEEDWN